MSNQIFETNVVNGTATPSEDPLPGSCSPAQKRGLAHHPVIARVKWSKEVKKVVMECFYRSKPFDE